MLGGWHLTSSHRRISTVLSAWVFHDVESPPTLYTSRRLQWHLLNGRSSGYGYGSFARFHLSRRILNIGGGIAFAEPGTHRRRCQRHSVAGVQRPSWWTRWVSSTDTCLSALRQRQRCVPTEIATRTANCTALAVPPDFNERINNIREISPKPKRSRRCRRVWQNDSDECGGPVDVCNRFSKRPIVSFVILTILGPAVGDDQKRAWGANPMIRSHGPVELMSNVLF